MSITPTHLLICSRDRENFSTSSPSNFTIQIEGRIDLKCHQRVALASCIIPNTFYNFTALNNVFGVNGTIYTIPPGCYNLSEVLATVQTLVQVNNPSMTINLNTIQSYLTWSNPTAFTLDMTQSKLYKAFSFLPQIYSGSTSYNGMYAPIIDNCNFVYVQLDFGGQSVMSSANTFTTFVVPNETANKGDYFSFNARTNYYHPTDVKRTLINNLGIQVRDMGGNILQGLSDWCMLLQFE